MVSSVSVEWTAMDGSKISHLKFCKDELYSKSADGMGRVCGPVCVCLNDAVWNTNIYQRDMP